MTPTQTGDKPMVTDADGRHEINVAHLEQANAIAADAMLAIGAFVTDKQERGQAWIAIRDAALSSFESHREQETREQPLDTIQRLGQEFDGEQARLGREALIDGLRDLRRGYLTLLENARDRIIFLGGDCDPLDRMVEGDTFLRAADRLLECTPPSSPDLAEENERLREAFAGGVFSVVAGGGQLPYLKVTFPGLKHAHRADEALRATLQSISTTKGEPVTAQ